MLMEDVSALLELSLMECNVKIVLLITVSVFPILTGMELTVFVSQALQVMEIHAFVKELLWEIIVKDVVQNLTLSIRMASVSVTLAL